MKILSSLLLVVVFLALPMTVVSQIPNTISYQGVLVDSLGNPKPDGIYTFTFRLYTTSTPGSQIWTEVKDLDVQNGLFSTQLGDVTPFAPTVQFDSSYWLGVKPGSAPELLPLIPLSSVAYSLNSLKADTAEFAKGAGSTGGAAGGDLTGTYPNPSIAANAVGSSEIAANAVTSSEIQNSAVTMGKINQSGAGVGDVIQWNGAAWAPESGPAAAFEGFGSKAPLIASSLAWDSIMIQVPAVGFLQATAHATLYLSNLTGCPCTYTGNLYLDGVGFMNNFISNVTLDAVDQRLILSVTGGIPVTTGGNYTIQFRLYRSSGTGTATTAYGNGNAIWVPVNATLSNPGEATDDAHGVTR